MAAQGKEILRPQSDEVAARQLVEGYIEQVEKQVEIPSDVQQWVKPGSGNVTIPQIQTDDFGQMVMQQSVQQVKPITLPLTAEELDAGLHHKVFDSLRWLAEWSVKMIKKYPGRVFYSS